MNHLTPSLSPAQLRKTLTLALDCLARAYVQVDYRLVGTGAALLHGVSLPAADIDILVRERSSVDAFCQALAPFKCLEAPAWLAQTQQYYGNYEVNGVEVGISTVEVPSDLDIIETFGRGPWEHFTLLPCGSHTVPTVALELRLLTELYRDRPDRYEPLIEFMRLNGCDVDFMQRGLAAIGLPPDRQGEVLGRLKRALLEGDLPAGA